MVKDEQRSCCSGETSTLLPKLKEQKKTHKQRAKDSRGKTRGSEREGKKIKTQIKIHRQTNVFKFLLHLSSWNVLRFMCRSNVTMDHWRRHSPTCHSGVCGEKRKNVADRRKNAWKHKWCCCQPWDRNIISAGGKMMSGTGGETTRRETKMGKKNLIEDTWRRS